MERLTVRNENGSVRMAQDCSNGCDYLACSMEEGYHCEHQCEADAMCKLADYEDAEEQGLLLRLPVAIGEEVYSVINNIICKNRVLSYQTAPEQIGGVIARGYMGAKLGIVGKNVFATKEEAEAALAEKGGVE